MLTRRQVSTLRGSQPPSNNSQQKEATRIKGEKGEATESAILTGTQESNENESSSGIVEQKEVKSIEIDDPNEIRSVAFVADGQYIVSGGGEGKIRRWQVKNGKKVARIPMDAGSFIWDMAVSPDGRWIVSGTGSGQVIVWNAVTHELVNGFKGHDTSVFTVDVSPDATKIVTGSDDETACVWSFSTGQRLLGPFKHDYHVIVVKFSPDGRLIATATQCHNSVRLYDSQDDHLVNFPIEVTWCSNQSLAWLRDSKQLFALSHDGNVHGLDVSTRTTLSKRPIHSNIELRCVSLATNGAFIAVSDDSSVSFWDTTTHEQIGSINSYPARVDAMAISANYDLVTGGGKKIILQNLRGILPSPYCDDVSVPASKMDAWNALFIDYNRCSKFGVWRLKKILSKRQTSFFVHSMSIRVRLSLSLFRLSNIYVHQRKK